MSLPDELPAYGKRTRRDHIAAVTSDLVGELMYYGRKEDEDLPTGAIEAAVATGEVTVDEICELFSRELRRCFP